MKHKIYGVMIHVYKATHSLANPFSVYAKTTGSPCFTGKLNFVLHVWEIMICMPRAHINKKWSGVSNKNFMTKYLLAKTTKLPLDRVLVPESHIGDNEGTG